MVKSYKYYYDIDLHCIISAFYLHAHFSLNVVQWRINGGMWRRGRRGHGGIFIELTVQISCFVTIYIII